MLRKFLWLGIFLSAIQPISLPAKQASLLGQLSPMKRAAQLSFPELPRDTMARIRGEKSTQTLPPEAPKLKQDWGLAHIGFFQVFSPALIPMSASTHACSPTVVVAVVDTGIDYTHPELKDTLWINSGESGAWKPPRGMEGYTACRDKSCNAVDDDANGFIDDVAGWDFVNEVPLPYDVHGHGSHISGIIAGTGGKGESGVCPGVSIMALKYYDASGVGYNNLQNTVRAFQYAVRMGALIINYSGGGTDPAPAERLAIENAKNHGVLVVAAAGNEGQNNDIAPYFPASYGTENILSVASINQESRLLPSSNWGAGRVHVAAPGQGVVSALPGGQLGAMTGTSQATAFVTGTAALLASQLPNLKNFDYRDIKRWIIEGAKPLPGNSRRTLLKGGLLSVRGSLDHQRVDLDRSGPAQIPALALNPGSKKLSPRGEILPISKTQ